MKCFFNGLANKCTVADHQRMKGGGVNSNYVIQSDLADWFFLDSMIERQTLTDIGNDEGLIPS